MSMALEQARIARQLLNRQSLGVLSTHSADIAGYPFGSITPYILNYDGEPIMLISDIAQHTRNIKQNSKVSLIVFEQNAADPQASGRLTWIGDAVRLDPAEATIRQRYLRYFPSAESYFATHDFAFYTIRLRRARFIGGFGQIFWIEPETLLAPNPFRETEPRIIEHMNQDHRQALLHYCKVLKNTATTEVSMIGIDSEGFDLLADGRKLRIDFESPISTMEEARTTLVRLARQ